MTLSFDPRRNGWRDKFRWAARGLVQAMRSERNFRVHLAVVVLVVIAAAALRASLVEWCVLALCTTVVLAAEMFNTALEHLARAITQDHSDQVRDALDTSGGAVLLAAIGAAMVGGGILLHRLATLLGW
jgi:undecaprenol kinase